MYLFKLNDIVMSLLVFGKEATIPTQLESKFNFLKQVGRPEILKVALDYDNNYNLKFVEVLK